MQRTRFLMIGGFLGAGKTTTIARLARHYTDHGLRVGVVTNDQAYGLVDTHSLRALGFEVGEVPGACFCCKFNDLVETVAQLGAQQQPDVILTEPVGSCTDLMATVVQPLAHLFGDRYEVGPLVVLCKPEHGKKILGEASGGFSPQAAYIFLKQLEEAQLIALNKVDLLSDDEQERLIHLLKKRFPDKRVLRTSASTGVGFAELLAELETFAAPVDQALELDYDTYALGEAALGWLNCSVHLVQSENLIAESATADTTAQGVWAIDTLVLHLVDNVSRSLMDANAEPGHVKVLASAGSAIAVANWVASDSPVELSVASSAEVNAADLLINVRAHGDPDEFAVLVRTAIEETAKRYQLDCTVSAMQHFRPGRPMPTHRYLTRHG